MTDENQSALDIVESQMARAYYDIGRLNEMKNECDERIAQHRAELAQLKEKAARILAEGDVT